MFRKMLIATDGSDLSTHAALRAVPLAKLAGASIAAVYVQDVYPFTGIGESNPAGFQPYMAAARAEGMRAVEKVAAAAKTEGISIETSVVEDHQTARGIVEAAQKSGCDLIAMASHGRGGLARLVLGSVAAKVLSLSTVPVLIIK